MPEEMSSLKAKLLIYLLGAEGRSCTITHLATVFCVAKSTVSRSAEWCRNQNIIERNEDRSIALTTYGRQLAKLYLHRRNICREFLLAEGVPQKSAEQDAIHFAVAGSEDSLSVLERFAEMHRIKQSLGNQLCLSGREFCEVLQDGSYPFSFLFYRCKCREQCAISPSMANKGFVHPGELVVKNKNGLIILKAKPIEHVSALSGFKVQGILQNLQYKEGGRFKEAGKEADTFYFPASGVEFLNVGAGRLFQGSTILKMSCSAGVIHMPESTAIFTMFF